MDRSQHSLTQLFFRSAVLLILIWQSVYFIRTSILDLGDADYFLHGPNLIFHEAGHVIFAIFGNDLLTAFGGSLFQCLFPLLLAIAFLFKNRDGFAACCMLWWVGQNLVDVAPYINDARSLNLILLGGYTGREVEGHDWEFILGRLGLLNEDIYIARRVLLIGRLVMITSLITSAIFLLFGFQQRLSSAREARQRLSYDE
ncbi:MAG: zinc ribbon domain-containing protein [Verrucomicrobiota bacterium]